MTEVRMVVFLNLRDISNLIEGRQWRPGKPVTAEDSPMDGLSVWHWIVVILVVLFLFGRGKLSGLMTDVAQGIKAFRKAMAEDEKPADTQTKPAETID
jgi:sec-independent protein translocase protein TatA